MMSLVPAASRSCASIAAFIPEPHILLMVVQPVASGRPAASEAWRAGAWPCPAGSTQPMMTSSTCSGLILARSTAARIAAAPSSAAANCFSSPWNAPMGVRAAETMTMGSFMAFLSNSRRVYRKCRWRRDLYCCVVRHHLVSSNSSRPISILRISEVPAPISYSFASRHRRPVGVSLI